MVGAGALVGGFPAVAAAKCCAGDEHALRGLQDDLRQRPRRVEPAAVDRNVIFAAIDSFDREPVDEILVRRAADARQQCAPGGKRFATPFETVDRPFNARAGL